MGRAFRVRKRSNHLTIVVGDAPMNGVIPKQRGKKRAKVAATQVAAPKTVAPKAKAVKPAPEAEVNSPEEHIET